MYALKSLLEILRKPVANALLRLAISFVFKFSITFEEQEDQSNLEGAV